MTDLLYNKRWITTVQLSVEDFSFYHVFFSTVKLRFKAQLVKIVCQDYNIFANNRKILKDQFG